MRRLSSPENEFQISRGELALTPMAAKPTRRAIETQTAEDGQLVKARDARLIVPHVRRSGTQ